MRPELGASNRCMMPNCCSLQCTKGHRLRVKCCRRKLESRGGPLTLLELGDPPTRASTSQCGGFSTAAIPARSSTTRGTSVVQAGPEPTCAAPELGPQSDSNVHLASRTCAMDIRQERITMINSPISCSEKAKDQASSKMEFVNSVTSAATAGTTAPAANLVRAVFASVGIRPSNKSRVLSKSPPSTSSSSVGYDQSKFARSWVAN
mmetsp:Transcript_4520/g.10666  ORF Transcript_4520/g.10666 Transcript_4520/m.10666 type:complete len:206 (+) Transcript_4520:609-1226(+)